MAKLKLSVVVIARNEEKMIKDCLESAQPLADEIIVIDTGSADQTVEIAKKAGTKVFCLPFKKFEFAKWRDEGLKMAKNEWLFYLDADERMTPNLQKEIQSVLPQAKFAAYEIPRQNFYLGRPMHYGGSWPDYVKRLFKKEKLKSWRHELHEDPLVEGDFGRLENPLLHYTHRDLSSMMEKTREWSKIEAKLLFDSGHPPVTWWRILRPMVTEFWQRGIRLQGLRDGPVGLIEVIFQMFSRFITYARLWEMQSRRVAAGDHGTSKNEK